MFRRTFAEINLDHLIHNFRLIRKELLDMDFLCPMVKANAYGHGDVEVGKALQEAGAQHLGVCLIEEGLLLRRNSVNADILVFRGFDQHGAKVILDNNLIPVVSSWGQLDDLEKASQRPYRVHLKFNTGMNRLGFQSSEAPALVQYLKTHSKVKLEGILTHLFHGEDAFLEVGHSSQQLRDFDEVCSLFEEFSPHFHALNSAGIISKIKANREGQPHQWLHKRKWGARPGLMIYGYNPLNTECSLDLRPAMSLRSFASAFRKIKRGETVSYSGTWKAQRDSVIAVVPIGYADGYHRLLSNRSHALFLGFPVPVVGNITMDYLMLDVTDIVKDHHFDELMNQEVVLFGVDASGQFLSAEKLAVQAQTITWEILTSVGERVPRVYRRGGE